MVDYTLLGVAALGLIGTLGAGAIGFAGPSWNDRRIQREHDRRDARRAIRLVAAEIEQVCIDLDNRLLKVGVDGMAAAMDTAVALLPGDESQWHRNREVLATLVEDQAVWMKVAWFYSSVETFKSLESPELQAADESQRTRVRDLADRLVNGGRDAARMMQALIADTNAPQETIEVGS